MTRSGNFQLALSGDVFLPNSLFTDKMGSERLVNKDRFLAPFANSDLVLCNFEAPLIVSEGSREDKKYNLMNSPECLEFFDDRFVLGLANNHIMDFGEPGFRRTILELTSRGLSYAGAGANIKEASRPVIITRSGYTIAIICAADPRFQPAGESTPGTMPAHPELLTEIIREAQERSDFIILSLHAGMEFTPVPTPFMMSLAELCLEAGAHIIQFHHTHCLSGFSWKKGKLVIWGAGNYAFPYIIPRGFSPWFESAVWVVAIDSQRQMNDARIIPIKIEGDGLPVVAQGSLAEGIEARIKKYSLRINSGRSMYFWRLLAVLNPVYLWLALNHFGGMMRRAGMGSVFRYLISALKFQKNGKQT